MVGLDTNVLVRYLVQDDPKQSKIATQIIEKDCAETDPGFINHIVLCETLWVLDRLYKVKKSLKITILEKILKTKQFQIQDPEMVWLALKEFQKSKADFPDCLIAQINLHTECDTTFTFDRNAGKSKGYSLL